MFVKFRFRLLVVFVSFCFFSSNIVLAESSSWDHVDEILNRINEPVFKNTEYNITKYGAKTDGKLNTKAIQKAIDVCHKKGGGKVIVPQGEFYTGPLTLKSNVNLHLEEGAVLKFSNNPDDYMQFVQTRWEGMDCINFHPLIYAYEQENIAVTGKGVLDGQADEESWWYMKGRDEYGWKEGLNSQEHGGGRDRLMQMVKDEVPVEKRIMTKDDCLRPQFINPTKCKNVLIDGVKIIRAPFWVIHPLFSTNVIVRGVSVKSHGPNNDGCDPESCTDVLIEQCTFDTGDDCIAIKSGRNNDGRNSGKASENIIVRDCNMKDGHGGVVIGSEISAGCKNVFVENCEMDSPNLDRVIRIKSNTVRGGEIENLYVRNIKVGQCKEAVFRVEFKYEKKDGKGPYFPALKNVELKNVVCQKSKYGVFIEGIDEGIRVSDVKFVDCTFNNIEQTSRVTGAERIEFQNVNFMIDEVK